MKLIQSGTINVPGPSLGRQVTGVGTALTALVGWVYFKDPFQVGALVGIGIIILGVVVLNLFGAKH